MACPYAKQIKGSIAFCQLVKRKVSTLRYPCKGNYRRCPIYLRYGARAQAPAPRAPAPSEAPAPQREVARPATPEEVKPTPARRVEIAAPRQAPTRVSAGSEELRPSKVLCDSLVLASLTVAAKPLGIARGKLTDVISKAREYLDKESFIFILGDIEGYRMRILFAGNHATYSFEKAGMPICGGEAESVFNKVRDSEFNGIYYRVRLDDVPLWRDSIMEELGAS